MRNKYTVQKILAALIFIQVILFTIDLLKVVFPSAFGAGDIHFMYVGSFVVSMAIGAYCYGRINKTSPKKYKDLVLNCIAATIVVQLGFSIISDFL